MELRLEPGDLILVRTPRLAYAAMRAFAQMPYDHIGVVVSGERVLNIVRAGAVFTPASRMLTAARTPRILRPAFPSAAERDAFVAELESLAPCRYDAFRGAAVVALTGLKHRLGLRLRVGPPPDASERRYVCSEPILRALARHHPGFPAAAELELDRDRLGVATLDDYLTLASRRPDVLRDLAACG